MAKKTTDRTMPAPLQHVERQILVIRGQRVLLDSDLAVLYGVATKVLNQAVTRNRTRFPEDFMFQLTWEEARRLRSQSVTLRQPGQQPEGGTGKHGRHPKYQPRAFTEQGVAMLSSVLRSKRAVSVNIEVMRAFVRLRGMLASNAILARRLAVLERKYDSQFKAVFDAIRRLMVPPDLPKKRPIGFAEWEA